MLKKAGGGSREIQENLDSMAKLLVVFCQVFFLVLGCYMIYWLVSEIKGKTVNKDVIASMNLYCKNDHVYFCGCLNQLNIFFSLRGEFLCPLSILLLHGFNKCSMATNA